MNKSNLRRSLEAELLKIERQDKKIYGVGETRYDLMIKDVLNYIDNSIPKEVIEELKREVYTDDGIGFELDYDEKPGAIRVLNKLLEGK